MSDYFYSLGMILEETIDSWYSDERFILDWQIADENNM